VNSPVWAAMVPGVTIVFLIISSYRYKDIVRTTIMSRF